MLLPVDPVRLGQAGWIARRLKNRFPVPNRFWAAFSGGLDSHVLLHLLSESRHELPAPLSVVHVDHGLQPAAAEWAAHCRRICARLDLPLDVLTVQAAPVPGQSPEAAARDARYAAIAQLTGESGMLLTAHHRDDQAETVLLQLMRGAGVDGLSAMPMCKNWRGGWHARPLLDVARRELRDLAEAEGLDWVDDPSNACTNADRNFIRHEVMPVLSRRWPAAADSLASSAGLCAEAARIVDEQARVDLAGLTAATDHDWMAGMACLRLDQVCALDDARARAAIRYWLRTRGAAPIPQRRLREAVGQLCSARADAAVEIIWAGLALRRYRGYLWLVSAERAPVPHTQRDWAGELLQLGPGLGTIERVSAVGGIAPAHWRPGRVQIGYRAPGLRCRLTGREGSRSFKDLAQACGIPPWLRDHLPVLYIDGDVAAVANCCVCQPYAAAQDAMGWHLRWTPS